jgi:uncharacterized OsmC-like protein
MTTEQIAAALRRVQSALERRPDFGLKPDVPATARWAGGTRVIASHPDGTSVATDMPCELGGSGDQVSPGWLFRAAIASCLATRIAMAAAMAGVELTQLEVEARSQSDTRGLLGMKTAGGSLVGAGPIEMRLSVRIGAPGVSADRLRALVDDGNRHSPLGAAAAYGVPVRLELEIT